MNILKLRGDAADCTWIPANEVEIIQVVDADTVDIRFLGTADALAHDEVAITATGKATEVAKIIAGYIQADGKQKGLLDVAAIDGVTSIAAIVAA